MVFDGKKLEIPEPEFKETTIKDSVYIAAAKIVEDIMPQLINIGDLGIKIALSMLTHAITHRLENPTQPPAGYTTFGRK